MSLVPDAARAAVALACLALAGCGGSDSDDEDKQPAATLDPTAVRLVDCGDWQAADEGRRDEMVAALRRFAGGPSGSPAGHGTTLEDADAHQLFDSRCAPQYAAQFKLYKLYTRAAAFAPR